MIRCSAAGSLRRFKEIIGDIDLLASSKKPAEVIEFFVSQPGIVKVTGERRNEGERDSGRRHPVRFARGERRGISVRAGVFHRQQGAQHRHAPAGDSARPAAERIRPVQIEGGNARPETARAVQDGGGNFCRSWICRSSRRNCARITANLLAAEKNDLPKLIEWTDLKGALHNHSTWSDGHNTLEEIAEYMDDLGLEYWAITDHSKSSFQANGLDAKRLREQNQGDQKNQRRHRPLRADYAKEFPSPYRPRCQMHR